MRMTLYWQRRNKVKDFRLTGSLAPHHREAGMELFEIDDHIIELRQHDKVIAHYSATGVTIEQIVKDADRWLNEQKGNR